MRNAVPLVAQLAPEAASDRKVYEVPSTGLTNRDVPKQRTRSPGAASRELGGCAASAGFILMTGEATRSID